jgi:hypothetical protein
MANQVFVALVGHRGVPIDEVRKGRCEALYRAMVDVPIGTEFRYDPIDLVEGRDFLKETTRYDAVVLQYVFRSQNPDPKSDPSGAAFTIGSPLSTWSNWRKRLIASGARVIFAHGRGSEVSGVFLKHIDGYARLHLGGTSDLTVFFKEEPMQETWATPDAAGRS